MTRSVVFQASIWREVAVDASIDDYIEEEYIVEGRAYPTGANNHDIGGGGPRELNHFEIDTCDITLTDAEYDIVQEAAAEALYQ